MRYSLEIKRSAEREMDRLPPAVHKRISEKILTLHLRRLKFSPVLPKTHSPDLVVMP